MPDLLKEAALDAPHLPAVITPEKKWTFSELDQWADSFSFTEGQRVPFAEAPSPRAIAMLLAVWRRGAVLCPLNLRLPNRELLIERLQTPDRKPFDLLLSTSGSTGTPKIAALTLDNLIASAKPAIEALDLRAGDEWLLSLPLFHVGGLGIVVRCMLARAAVVIGNSPGITHLSYVPTHLHRATPVYKNLRCLMLGGAAAVSYPKNLPVYMTYGLTEMASLVTARIHPPCIDGHFYLGMPLPGREVKLAKDGEILVRGACLFQGYLGEEPQQGWFATGDLGKWSNEGLAIVGRKDWMFISGGENIQPEEIERELLLLPEIEEAVVVPIPDLEFGHRPAAAVKGTITLEKMRSSLAGKLPKFKIPVALILFDEIPKNGLKIARKQIFETICSKYLKK